MSSDTKNSRPSDTFDRYDFDRYDNFLREYAKTHPDAIAPRFLLALQDDPAALMDLLLANADAINNPDQQHKLILTKEAKEILRGTIRAHPRIPKRVSRFGVSAVGLGVAVGTIGTMVSDGVHILGSRKLFADAAALKDFREAEKNAKSEENIGQNTKNSWEAVDARNKKIREAQELLKQKTGLDLTDENSIRNKGIELLAFENRKSAANNTCLLIGALLVAIGITKIVKPNLLCDKSSMPKTKQREALEMLMERIEPALQTERDILRSVLESPDRSR